MSEPDPQSEAVETPPETLEQALARNFSASKESVEVDTDTSPPAEVETVAATPAESDTQESVDALEPLEKWNDDIKTMFRSLPIDAQKFVLDRNHDVESYLTKESQAVAEVRKRYERLDDVFKPYETMAKQNGVDLTPHVAQALQYYFAYTKDPVGTLKALAKSANVDLSKTAYEDDADPDIKALKAEVQATKQQLAELRGRDTQSAQSQLEAFQNAKNADGTAKYPHFDNLRAQMAPLVGAGKSLEDAYNETLWTLPDYRQSQLEAQRKQALKDAEAERAEKAKKAKGKTTLPASDVEAGTRMPKMNGKWDTALKHTLSKMR